MSRLLTSAIILNLISIFACFGQNDTLISNGKNKVILVHGFLDKPSKMSSIAKHLEKNGLKTYSITLYPANGKKGIDELALQLDRFVKDSIPSDQKFDLVGFSMGGLVARYYIQRLGGVLRVEHFISISTPHCGTGISYLWDNKGSRQMRLNSDFINDLNSDIEILSQVKTTSIWTPLDMVIIPASSSHINTGEEIKIWCPVHDLMVRNARCIKAVGNALSR